MNTTTDDMDHIDDFLEEDDQLVLEWKGREYRIEPVSAKVGLRVERIISAAERNARGAAQEGDQEQVLSDSDELDLYPDLLGDVYEQMLDDGVTFIRLKLAATATMMWTVYDEEVALEYWNAGGKAPAPNREQRRAKTTRTGGATSTKRPGSGTGTSTRRKPSATQRKATD